ncbi:MAG: FG-GAP-like repeat-containing protein [Rubricoccaceae bacterium]|nr:FG-GAP-like repeat-containing protein [Rubricoccaceae bacterium]
MRLPVLLAAVLLGTPAAISQPALPFDGVPWLGYNAGTSAFDANPNPTERDPYAIAAADFDGDGDQDAVVANYDYPSPGGTDGSSGFALLFNRGDGTYAEPVHYTVSTKGHFDIEVADFDEDGDLDLAMPHSGRLGSEIGSSVVLYLNDGGGAFTPGGEFDVQTMPLDIDVGDFNGDGHLDIVAGSSDFSVERIAVLLGDGAGGFAPQIPIDMGDTLPTHVVAGDFNGDGYDDIAAEVLYNLLIVMSDGAGGFLPPVMLTDPGFQDPHVVRISPVDYDEDGVLDLLVAIDENAPPGIRNDLAFYRGNGDGTFAAPVLQDVGRHFLTPEALVPGDLDGDGHLDLAVCEFYGVTGDGIITLFGDGTGHFSDGRLVPAGQTSADLALADVDGDGDLDVLAADRMSLAVTVHRNPGDGLLPELTDRFSSGVSIAIHQVAGDVDGDGDLDLFASGGSFGTPGAVVKNNGDGTFGTPTTITHSTQYGRGTSTGKLRDLDGDGDLDILYNDAPTDFFTGYDFWTALNDGTGTFAAPVEWDLNTAGNGDIDAFDLDNDGDLDVANLEELGAGTSGHRLWISLNNGDATFQPPYTYQLVFGPHAIAGDDLNRDGNVDLVVAHEGFVGNGTVVSVLLGNGDGTLQAPVTYTVGRGPDWIVIEDLDADGHLDITTANSGFENSGRESLTVLFGTGTGTFTGRTDYYVPYAPDLHGTTGFEAGDVDGDGDLDLMVTTVANGIAMYYNDGAGGFTFPHRLGVYWSPRSPLFEDFDGDGVPDLLMLIDDLDLATEGNALVLLPGLSGQVAPVAVAAEPVGGPITIPAGGGTFAFTITLTNTTAEPQGVEAWSAVSGPADREPVLGPRAVTLPPGATVVRTLTQQVPGAAPAGAYTYTVNVGTFGSAVTASDSFLFTKEGGATRGAAYEGEWSATGWDEAAARAALLEGEATLDPVYPNPFTRAATVGYTLPGPGPIRLVVYDVLGREVAVLEEGMQEAGAHASVLDASGLAPGTYLVRLGTPHGVLVQTVTLVP